MYQVTFSNINQFYFKRNKEIKKNKRRNDQKMNVSVCKLTLFRLLIFTSLYDHCYFLILFRIKMKRFVNKKNFFFFNEEVNKSSRNLLSSLVHMDNIFSSYMMDFMHFLSGIFILKKNQVS